MADFTFTHAAATLAAGLVLYALLWVLFAITPGLGRAFPPVATGAQSPGNTERLKAALFRKLTPAPRRTIRRKAIPIFSLAKKATT